MPVVQDPAGTMMATLQGPAEGLQLHALGPGHRHDRDAGSANTYPAGRTSIASQRYLLAAFIFDHVFSVPGETTPGTNCGGFESPIVVELLTGMINDTWQTSFLRRSDHVEFPFIPGNTRVTLNGAVPAGGRTWGGIKAAYRR